MYEISSKTIEVLSIALRDLCQTGVEGPAALSELARLIRKHGHIPVTLHEDHKTIDIPSHEIMPQLHEHHEESIPDIPAHENQGLPSARLHEVAPDHHDQPPVVFVLGGPGSGKGTICDRLVTEHGFGHLSVGELLRAEVESGSEMGHEVEKIMKEGGLVPDEVAMTIISKAIHGGARKILLDGFPRTVEQAIAFEARFGPANQILWLTCEESVMVNRILARGQSSGRADDNAETVAKRIKTFNDNTSKIHDHYMSMPSDENKRFHVIDSSRLVDEVYHDVKAALNL